MHVAMNNEALILGGFHCLMLCTEIDKLYLGEFVLLEGIVKQFSVLLLFYNAMNFPIWKMLIL